MAQRNKLHHTLATQIILVRRINLLLVLVFWCDLLTKKNISVLVSPLSCRKPVKPYMIIVNIRFHSSTLMLQMYTQTYKCKSMLYLWDTWPSYSNLQHLVQKVDVSSGALVAVLQGLAPQFLTHFWVASCLLGGWGKQCCMVNSIKETKILPTGILIFNTGPGIKVKKYSLRSGIAFI